MNKTSLLARIMGVKFVTVTLRDAEISLQMSKVASPRNPDPILSISIPLSRVINFVDNSSVIERVVYHFEDGSTPLVFTKHSSEYIYDLDTGELIELVLHGKVVFNG